MEEIKKLETEVKTEIAEVKPEVKEEKLDYEKLANLVADRLKPKEPVQELAEKKTAVGKQAEDLKEDSEIDIQYLQRSFGMTRNSAKHLLELNKERKFVHDKDGSVTTKDIEEAW